ncbi:unnamed protein product [Symbiodinium natans]|uniref:Uncharacterized protein n=1 Tax=Symbiodinium natans TaxID=878477 RepID=A0A812RI01_9DINO|nr:unnamed protein product [Symbiodinium natans]
MLHVCLVASVAVCLARAHEAPPCISGEQVQAYFAGEVDFGDGVGEPCNPSLKECWFDAEVQSGPDEHGTYHVTWADATPSFREAQLLLLIRCSSDCWEVHGSQLHRAASDEACGIAAGAALQSTEDTGAGRMRRPTAPSPTLMLRLHWEASDVAWRDEAIAKLRAEFRPQQVIGDFDWHVVMRFGDPESCDEAHDILRSLLSLCVDSEGCFRHPFVQAVEYEDCQAHLPQTRHERLDL